MWSSRYCYGYMEMIYGKKRRVRKNNRNGIQQRNISGFDLQTALSRALQLHGAGNFRDAETLYRDILQHDANHAYAIHSLGVLALQKDKYESAVSYFKRAIHINPEDPAFHNNLGFVFGLQGKTEKAIAHFKRAIGLDPYYAEPHHNLGNLLKDMGQLHEAIEYQERAIAIRPDFIDAQYNRATALLLLGKFKEGLSAYEWRWQRKSLKPRNFTQPLWDGSHLSGRTILIHAEQGLGDTLQFIRYAKFAKMRGGRVVAAVQAPLLGLLGNCDYLDSVIPLEGGWPHFDAHAPLMSLPLILNTTLKTIPADVPYITTDSDLVEYWRNRFAGIKDFKIGLCWKTSGLYEQHNRRSTRSPKSIPLEKFQGLVKRNGYTIFSLQKEPLDGEKKGLPWVLGIHDFGPDFDTGHGSFMDTVAVMRHLDLVITIDTAVAHLAGALGIPVWVLLPYIPDWRWLMDRNESPWYPTMRLFRQPRTGNWDSVVEDVEEALTDFSESRSNEKKSMITPQKRELDNDCIKMEVSFGDFIDKFTILKIKSERVSDSLKRKNIITELELFQSKYDDQIGESDRIPQHIEALMEVNKALWDIEDAIRKKEREKAFDQDFIRLARSVYHKNDRRAQIKREINRLMGSHIIEEKSYSAY